MTRISHLGLVVSILSRFLFLSNVDIEICGFIQDGNCKYNMVRSVFGGLMRRSYLYCLESCNNSSHPVKSDLKLDLAVKGDLRECANLCVDVFFSNAHFIDTTSQITLWNEKKRCLKMLKARIGSPDIVHFIVRNTPVGSTHSMIVGFVELCVTTEQCSILGAGELFKPKRPKIFGLAVHPDYRQQGIGRLLVEACLAQARQWGHYDVFLELRDDNTVGRAMYEKLGFRENSYASQLLNKNSNIGVRIYMCRSGV